MKILRLSCCRPALLLLAVLLLPQASFAWTATAGWTHADVGLNDKGDGICLGLANAVVWPSPVFDVSYGLEYVQKKGSQPTPFASPTTGLFVDDAAVTLHVLEPGVFLGARLPVLGLVPRLYVGGSIGLKVKESWSEFPGLPDQQYGYKETDAIVHLGASLGLGPVGLDVRWSRSLVGQLLIDPNPVRSKNADKATTPLAGVRVPEVGFDPEVLRLGVTYVF